MAISCPACGGKYADHFTACVHCNAPRPGETGRTVAPAPPAPPPEIRAVPEVRASAPPAPPAAAPRVAPTPPAPPKPECPSCGGDPGRGTVRMEKREYQGSNWSGSKKKYLVRWVDIPGVCAPCMRSLELRRYAADVLCNVPFVVFFLLLVIFDSKAFLWPLLIYALVLFKWSWGLGYVWADLLVYGRWLDSSLARFEPPGDAGTTRFPAGLWHCLVRLGMIPALCVLLVLVAGLFGTRPSGGKNGTAAAAPESSDPVERARAFFSSTQVVAVPIDPETLLMARMKVNRDDIYFFRVYATPSELPRDTDYLLMTPPQVLTAFIRASSRSVDLLHVPGRAAIERRDAAALALTLTPVEPPATKLLRSP